MMKIVGIVTLTISSMLLGLSLYKKYKIRPVSLNLFINILNKYLLELKWKHKSIVEVINECADGNYLNNFKKLSLNNTLVDSAINCNDEFQNLFLNKKDEEILKYFFESSGKSSIENEILLCTNTIDQLKKQKELAELNFNKMGPLSIKLCFVLGVWIVIVFI